jgi:beta-alanine degradation protein BauB
MSEPSDLVATEVVFDNAVVRVWTMDLAPGEESVLHKHSLDYMFIYPSASRIEVRAQGEPARTFDFAAGYVQYVRVGEGVVHQIKNVADEAHRHIVVEVKHTPSPAPSSDNGRKTPA